MSRRFYYSAILLSATHLLLVLLSFHTIGYVLEPNPGTTPVANFIAKMGENVLWLPLLGGWTDEIRRLHISIDIVALFLNSFLWGFTAALILSSLTHRLKPKS